MRSSLTEQSNNGFVRMYSCFAACEYKHDDRPLCESAFRESEYKPHKHHEMQIVYIKSFDAKAQSTQLLPHMHANGCRHASGHRTRFGGRRFDDIFPCINDVFREVLQSRLS